MEIEKIERIAHAEMATRQDLSFREPGWILYHGKRTGKIAVHLAKLLDCDANPEVLYVAGLFHDIGKGQERHNEVGAEITRKLLADFIPEDQLALVCDAVGLHNQRKKSDAFSETVKLIQDADLVDHVGPIDVWMAFYWSGSHGESFQQHLAFCRSDDCKRYRDHMRTHLNFEVSRELLEERIKSADEFLSSFHKIYFEGI